MESLIDYIEKIVQLSPVARERLLKIIRPMEFAKNEIVVETGAISRNAYFIERGLARVFYYREATDITDYFAYEGQFIGGIESFYTQQPGRKGIQALEPCTMLALPHSELEKMYADFPEMERLGRLMMTYAFLTSQRRLESIQFLSARERYEQLLKEHPAVVQRAPLGHIASYIGVTQVSLSRIRAGK